MNTAVRDDDTLPSDLARTLGRSVRSWAIGDTSVSSWAAASETGRQRSHNEDAWGQRESSVFVVADGMGGRPGGAVAADGRGGGAARRARAATISSGGAAVDWRQVMRPCQRGRRHRRPASRSRRTSGRRSRWCTRVPTGTVVAHAGDVRVYRLRDDAREAITSDHTVATELEFAGLRPDDVPDARGRLGALSSFLGDGEAWRAFSVRMLDIRGGDRLVVCSDGVHRHASADDVAGGRRDAVVPGPRRSPRHVGAARRRTRRRHRARAPPRGGAVTPAGTSPVVVGACPATGILVRRPTAVFFSPVAPDDESRGGVAAGVRGGARRRVGQHRCHRGRGRRRLRRRPVRGRLVDGRARGGRARRRRGA